MVLHKVRHSMGAEWLGKGYLFFVYGSAPAQTRDVRCEELMDML